MRAAIARLAVSTACGAPPPGSAAPVEASSVAAASAPTPSSRPRPPPRTDDPRYPRWAETETKALIWLDTQRYDPMLLGEVGIDGVYINSVKTWGELMKSYLILGIRSDEDGRLRVREKVERLARAADRSDFHALDGMNGREFKGNSMSYMRLMWVTEGFGFDSTRYRTALEALKPRMDAHLDSRGGWQREVFNVWYGYLGRPAPPILTAAYRSGLGPIAERTPARDYTLAEQYILTHYLFVPTIYGYSPYKLGHFDEAELAYLEEVLPSLTAAGVDAGKWDITAELISCMNYVGLGAHPGAQEAITSLLVARNGDGSFGDVSAVVAEHGPRVGEHAKLHTTLVALRAPAEYFDPMPWNTPGPLASP